MKSSPTQRNLPARLQQLQHTFAGPPTPNSVERNKMLDSILQDFRYSLRSIVRQPMFSLLVILTLGLGVGANSAIFSVVNGTLLTPLPYPGSERIVTLWEDFSTQGGPSQEWIEVPNFFEWKEHSRSFETMSAYGFNQVNLILGDEAEVVTGAGVSHDFFRTFGVELALGREFSPEEDSPGAEPVVILSHDLWEERLGADSQILGRPLLINDQPTTVVGILPQGFQIPLANQVGVWQPVRISPTSHGRGSFFLQAIGRLKEGVPLERARAEMNVIMQRIGQEFPEDAGVTMQVIPLLDLIMQPVHTSLWALMAAVFLVLLIACANVANLILSRTVSRQREMAVRAALGARRQRLIRQLLSESVLLSLLGGGLGLLLGLLGCDLLISRAPTSVPRLDEVGLNTTVLFFTFGVSLFSAVVFGMAPALHGSRSDLNVALNAGGREARGPASGNRLRSVLIVAEVALVLTLLVGSGLLLRSFSRLQEVDPGFRPQGLLSTGLSLSSSRFPKAEDLRGFVLTLASGLEGNVGVDSVSGVSVLPMGGTDSDTGFTIEGRPAPIRPQDEPIAWYRRTLPNYFSAMGIPLLQGRDFRATDHANAAGVVIISEVTGERYWPGESALGKRIRFGDDGDWNTIVGIVPGIRHRALNQPPRPELYFPFSQRPGRFVNLIVKTQLPPTAAAELIRAAIREKVPGLPMPAVVGMDDLVEASIGQDRFIMGLTSGFAALAVILASVGIYGVISYSVSQRTYEMGLRMALGAPRSAVLGIVMRQGLLLTGLGITLGVGLSLWATRFIASLLFNTSPTDMLTFLLTAAFLGSVALVACLVPAYRATRIDPLNALRAE